MGKKHQAKVQAKYEAAKARTQHGAKHDDTAKENLTKKMAGKSPGRLTKKELELAARTGTGEGVITTGPLKRLFRR